MEKITNGQPNFFLLVIISAIILALVLIIGNNVYAEPANKSNAKTEEKKCIIPGNRSSVKVQIQPENKEYKKEVNLLCGIFLY